MAKNGCPLYCLSYNSGLSDYWILNKYNSFNCGQNSTWLLLLEVAAEHSIAYTSCWEIAVTSWIFCKCHCALAQSTSLSTNGFQSRRLRDCKRFILAYQLKVNLTLFCGSNIFGLKQLYPIDSPVKKKKDSLQENRLVIFASIDQFPSCFWVDVYLDIVLNLSTSFNWYHNFVYFVILLVWCKMEVYLWHLHKRKHVTTAFN